MQEILEAEDPLVQKKVKVRGYKQDEWLRASLDFMKEAVTKKFENNPDSHWY